MRGEQKPQNNEPSIGKVSDVEVVQETGTLITKREDIKKYVETPLIEACGMLWDKNVKTTWSSCSSKDFQQGHGVIGIDYESLSEENKKIGEEVGEINESGLGKTLWLKIPLTPDTTIEEARRKSIEFVSKFKKQKATWVPRLSQDDMIRLLGFREVTNELREKFPIESFVEEDYYLDTTVTPPVIFASKELFEKTLEEIN